MTLLVFLYCTIGERLPFYPLIKAPGIAPEKNEFHEVNVCHTIFLS